MAYSFLAFSFIFLCDNVIPIRCVWFRNLFLSGPYLSYNGRQKCWDSRHFLSTLDKFYPLPPLPETISDLLSAILASFVYNIEKGGGGVVQKPQQIKGGKTGILY